MPVVFLITIVAVLVGIFFAATGRGGELAYEHADHAPLDLGPVTAADVALLRPPTALWGYNMQVTDAALDQIARAVRERDITIAYLQEQVAGFERNGSYSEPRGAHARQASDIPLGPGLAAFAAASAVPGLTDAPEAEDTLEHPQPDDTLDVPPPADTLDDLLNAGTPGASSFADTPEASSFADTPEASSFADTPEASSFADTPEAPQPADTLEAPQPADTLESLQPAETRPPLETPPPAETPQDAEAPPSQEHAETPPPPEPPRTPLVLKASAARGPLAPESDEATQPNEILEDSDPHDATQPNEIHEAPQPAPTYAPDDVPGPQGSFNAHDWWAEQREAAREEDAQRQAAGPAEDGQAEAGPAASGQAQAGPAATGPAREDDSSAAAEEQGW